MRKLRVVESRVCGCFGGFGLPVMRGFWVLGWRGVALVRTKSHELLSRDNDTICFDLDVDLDARTPPASANEIEVTCSIG